MEELAGLQWPLVPAGPLVLVPLGSTEQHGPQLPLETDTLIAEAVARGAAEGLGATLVAPTLAYGASGEHEGFAGTVSIGTESLRAVIVELARSLRRWSPRVVFVNGHGGNLPAVVGALRQLRDEGHDAAWVPCAAAGQDAHAGFTETSILLHLRPDRVGPERPTGTTVPIARLMPDLVARGVRAVAADGVLGDASDASAEHGRRLLAEMVAGSIRRIRAAEPDGNGLLGDPDTGKVVA